MKTYLLPGDRIHSLEDFYREIGEAVNGPGGYFSSNLDALTDCLRGDLGTPEEDGFCFRWLHSAELRAELGYEETVRQLREKLATCHPLNRALVTADLERAQRAEGPTVFDRVVEIIRRSGTRLELA